MRSGGEHTLPSSCPSKLNPAPKLSASPGLRPSTLALDSMHSVFFWFDRSPRSRSRHRDHRSNSDPSRALRKLAEQNSNRCCKAGDIHSSPHPLPDAAMSLRRNPSGCNQFLGCSGLLNPFWIERPLRPVYASWIRLLDTVAGYASCAAVSERPAIRCNLKTLKPMASHGLPKSRRHR